MYYQNLPEEELKNRIGENYFADYDYKKKALVIPYKYNQM